MTPASGVEVVMYCSEVRWIELSTVRTRSTARIMVTMSRRMPVGTLANSPSMLCTTQVKD